MPLTPEQVKGRIKNIAAKSNADARTLLRIYMMERFLERLANSRYRDNFIIKGGKLVTAMVGVAHRSTMDIDATIKNMHLSVENRYFHRRSGYAKRNRIPFMKRISIRKSSIMRFFKLAIGVDEIFTRTK